LNLCGPEQLEDNQQTVYLIEQSGNDLLTIINDILDFSKVDADQVEIEWIPTDLRRIVEDVRQLILPRLKEKPDLIFQTEVDDNVPELILCDPTRLRQILGNICGNAVKFTEKGAVFFGCQTVVFDNTPQNGQQILDQFGSEINIHLFDNEPQITLLQFFVRDEGIGMQPEHLSKLFQPFTQADTSLTRRFGGTGLGLSIAKRLTILLDGDIIVQSEENRGSTFIVTLAARIIPPDTDQVSHSGIVLLSNYERPLEGMNVLLVEDGKVNQIVISTQLKDAGAVVRIAENGKLGLDAVEKEENGFDIILMDMQMPVMDGYEATFRLRQNGYKKPIIAVTAHALSGDCEKTLTVGCNAYISKPIDRNKLIDMILRFDQSSFSVQ
jgi:CheY-like chemotaxis protein